MISNRSVAEEQRYAEALNQFGKELVCPICLSFFREACRFPCNHYFCRECIVKYLKKETKCPICKLERTVKDIIAAPEIDEILNAYRGLVLPTGETFASSQPISPSKYMNSLFGIPREEISTPQKRRKMDETLEQQRMKEEKRESGSFVFLLTGLDASQRQLVTHVCTHSSARSVLEYCDEVTHCITVATKDKAGDYITNRTLKYLHSILGHKPVVSFEWVIEIGKTIDSSLNFDSKRKRGGINTAQIPISQFPSWEPFLVQGDKQMKQCTKGGPQRSVQLHTKLFGGMSFVLLGEFQRPLPNKEEIESLLQMGGGTIAEAGDKTIGIVGKKSSAPKRRPEKCVTYKWVFDSISNYDLVKLQSYLI